MKINTINYAAIKAALPVDPEIGEAQRLQFEEVFVELRRRSPLLFAVLQQLPKPKLVKHVTNCIDGNGQISTYVGLIDPQYAAVGGLPYGVELQTPAVRVWSLAHEICHFLAMHCLMNQNPVQYPDYTQKRKADPERLRKAVEYHCNGIVHKALGYHKTTVANPAVKYGFAEIGYDWPKDFDPTGMSWQQIYDLLPPSPPRQQGSGFGGSGGLPGPGDYDIIEAPDGILDDDGDGDSKPQYVTAYQIGAIVRRAAAQVGADAGDMPGALAQHLLKVDAQPLPWSVLLRRITAKAKIIRPSWRKRSKKGSEVSPCKGRALSMDNPTAMVYMDTSGSMSDGVIHRITRGLMTDTPCRVDITWFDTQVYPTVHLDNPDDVRNIKIQGRGGTDFDAPARHWLSVMNGYDVAICVTDGECALPAGGKLKNWYWLAIDDSTASYLMKAKPLEPVVKL